MKKVLQVFVFTFIQAIGLSAQDNYPAYHHLMREVHRLTFDEQYSLALEKFKSAEKLVNYVYAKDYRNLAVILVNLGSCAAGQRAYLEAVKQGLDFELDYLDFFKKKCSAWNEEYLSELKKEKIKFNNGINQEYKAIIDSLYHRDQQVRKTRNKNTELGFVDSTNIECLKKSIEKWGSQTNRR